MPKQLSPEEFEAMFGGGAPAEVPQNVGLSTMLGSGARSLGAGLLGIGEAVGLSSGDWRREQQAIANADAQRYFERTGAPRSFAEAQGVGETAQWLAGVGAQSLPSMIPVAAAGLVGGPGAAFAAGSALGLGDVLQNQREAGGRTDLTAAVPLGLLYGAADRFGVEGMLARRSLGTGVRALDTLGTGQLDKLTGFTGAAARTAATGAKGVLSEGTSETLQELANQAGRTAVSSETMFDPEAVNRYQESFIAGGVLGGVVSGGLGGWRRSAAAVADEGGAKDLTARETQLAVGTTPDQLEPETRPFTQDWFNKALGVDETLYKTDKNYAKAVGNLFEEGSGQFVQDTSSMAGLERELSMADAIMLRNGAIKMDDLQQLWQLEAIQGPMPRPGFVPPGAEASTPAAPSADQAGTQSTELDIDAAIEKRLGKKPGKYGRELWNDISGSGVPMDSKIADDLWNLAAQGNGLTKTKWEQVRAELDARLAELAAAATAPATAPQVGLQAPMAQPAAPGPRVFQQGVLQPAAPAGSAPVDLTAPRAPAAPAGSAPVDLTAPRAPAAPAPVPVAQTGLARPVAPAEPVVSPQRATLNLPKDRSPAIAAPEEVVPNQAAIGNAIELAKATGRESEIDAIIKEAAREMQVAKGTVPADMPMDEAAADAVFAKHFEKSKNPSQMVAQAKALIRARQAAPEGAKNKVVEAVGAALGLKKDTAYARVNETKLVETAMSMGYTREQAMDLLGVRAKTRGESSSLEKARNAYHELQDIDPARRTTDQIQQMADLKGELERLVESEARAKGLDMSTALSEAGVTFDPDEGAGIGGDDVNRWWSEAASRRAVDRAIGKLVTLGRQLQELRQATAELRGLGKEFRAGAKVTRDEAAKLREKLTGARAEAERAAIEEQNKIFRAAWEEANKGKKGAKPPKVVRAPVVAESKATPEQLAARKKWEESKRNLTKMETADLQTLLPYVRDVMENVALAEKISAELSNSTRGVENAIQVESANEVPAQPGAGSGGQVGQEVPVAEKPAGEGRKAKAEGKPAEEKVTAPAVIKTQRELAAEAWDTVAGKIPGAPKFAELSRAQQTDFVEFGEDNWTPADVRREMQRMQPAEGKGPRYGLPTAKAANPYTAKQLLKELKAFIRADIPGRTLLVVDDISDLLAHPDRAVQVVGAGMAVKGAYGVASDGRAFLVANRIEQGQGRAKFMHEVGSHLGLEKLLPKATYAKLVKQVKAWADSNADTYEAYLAERALARAYKVSDSQSEFDDETLAYFLEEAVSGGIDPTADMGGGPLREWFRTLWNAFKLALVKLGFKPSSMTAQDVVDLAFGAARLELSSATYGAPVDADRQRLRFGVGTPKKATASQVQQAINQLPPGAQSAVRNSLDTMGTWANKALDRAVFTSDLIDRAVTAGMNAAKAFGDYRARRDTKARELERAVEQIADMYALVPAKDRGLVPEKGQADTANQFIFDSTREGQWGYGEYATPEMKNRFKALSPQAQAFVKAVFKHGDDMLALKKRTIMDHTNTEYDALIAAAAADGDTQLEAKLKGEKQAVIKRFTDLFATQEGLPYAPIKRMGAYAVVAKSDAYRAAEAPGGDKTLLDKLQKQADHYHVSFTETRAEARELARQLREQGHFGTREDAVDFFEREANMDALFGGDSVLKALTKLQSQVEAKMAAGEQGAAKLRRMVTDMYLETLTENSARKSEMKRRGVAGEVDMLRSFTMQGRADANFLASVEYNRKIQDSIQAMRKERDLGGNRARKAELFNELTARYAQSMEDINTPVLSKLMRLASAHYLVTSPAYFASNALQPGMMSVPIMAEQHGYGKAWGAMLQAYKDLGDLVESAKLFSTRMYDYSKVGKNDDEKSAIQELVNRNRIDIGMETELGEFQVESAGPIANRMNKVNKGMRMLVQKVEVINRMSTALAAYRLELQRNGGNHDAAVNYADRILSDSHGDYGRSNAPRLFNTKLGKMALQFRKFQLIQLSYYAKLLSRAGFSTEEKRAASKALAYALLHTAALAGVRGLPGFAALAFVAGLLGGAEDKKFDLTAALESALGGGDMARLVMRGGPTIAGVDLSGSVGAGNMLSLMPFSNADLSTSAGKYEAIGQALVGASGGMVVRGLDGLGLMANGDWYKGLEMLMPKGLASAMQAYRLAEDGMTRRNGDVILPPEDVSALETFWKALSFNTPGISEVYEKRQRFQDVKDRFAERTSRIKNDYAKAVRSNDADGRQEARQAWTKLQATRKAEGFQPQPLSNLLKAPQEQAKREKQTVGGLQYRPNERAAAKRVAGE